MRGRGRWGALLAACAALAIAVSAPSASGAAVTVSDSRPQGSHTDSDGDGDSPTVALYAGNAGTQSAGQSVTVTITIANTTSKVVSPGTATIAITQKPLDSRDDLDAWLKPGGDDPATRVLASVPTQGVTAGTNQRVATFTIPEQTVGLSGATAVYGLEATVTDAGGTIGKGYSSLTYEGTGAQHQVGLAIAMPITVPPTSNGLIAPDDLATYTAADGLLTRQLDLARDHPSMAIAIDPMIIASIRVLGTSAPQSAQAWLSQLDSLTNDSFPLQYGDADVAAQLQSGLASLLAPTSFNYAMDPRNFPSQLSVGETPEPTPTATTNPFVTPTPTPTTQQPNVPTTAQLLSWPYTFSGIAWPADGSLRASDIDALAANGYPSAIVSGSNTNQSSLSVTPNAPMPVKGGVAVVTDQGVSDALRSVVTAIGTDEENAALASVTAQLAEISTQSSGGSIILAGLDRDWPANSTEASHALDTVFALPWVTASSLRDALTAPISSGLELQDASPDGARIAAAQALRNDAGNLDAFATLLADPTALTGQTRNELLSLLGVAWRQSDNNWPAAVAAFHAKAAQTLGSVKIDPTGKITVASAQSLIPVTVTNAFDLPVNIVLRATPSNNRLEVDSDTAKTIPAKASAKVLVPVKAKLGNGSVRLGLQLYSPTGLPIGTAQTAAIDVHADWEGLGALILGIAFVLFFGFGLTRSIVRRVRARGSAADDGEKAAESDAESDSDDAGTDAQSDPGAEDVTSAQSDAGSEPGTDAPSGTDAQVHADARDGSVGDEGSPRG
ncbi:DUF6049 family protein [Rathayibacter sp. KR2-224]|uniref:DUF6049 family protein n=1 Tax=Rathayibacter sp. KR2-224 TaxID=3400913 RepID=UPI003C074818